MAFLIYDIDAETIAIPITDISEPFVIGRSKDNTLSLRGDSMVSRHHCSIYNKNETFYIKDLNSSNGTIVNEIIINGEELPINDMDQITIGNINFVFVSMEDIPYNKNTSGIIQVNSPVPDISSPENSSMLETIEFDSVPSPEQASILKVKDQDYLQIDGYEIIKEVGKSKCNFSTVYFAFQLEQKRSVAIKIFDTKKLPEELKDDFLTNIRIAAQLQHPNIISYINAGLTGNFCYITMQYAELNSLKNRLAAEGRIDEEEANQYIIQLAEALQYVNQRQILHYNISLNNILFLKNGEPVISDFGLAEWITKSYQLNRTQFFGSTTNMPPEQMLDQPLNWTCDQYALGTVFYEMLVGKPCFDAPSIYALIEKHLREKVRFPSDVQISAKTKNIITKMMGKEPPDRYGSWHELITALKLEPKEKKKKLSSKTMGIKRKDLLGLRKKNKNKTRKLKL